MKNYLAIVFVSLGLLFIQSSFISKNKTKKSHKFKSIHTKVVNYFEDGSDLIFSEYITYYNKKGGEDSVVTVINQDKNHLTEQYYYDKKNRLDSIFYYDLNKNIYKALSYEYDDNNNVITETVVLP